MVLNMGVVSVILWLLYCPIVQLVKTPDFDSGNMGSNPVGVTKNQKSYKNLQSLLLWHGFCSKEYEHVVRAWLSSWSHR